MVKNGLQLSDQKKCYRFIHISGVHPPYTINESLQEVKDGTVSWWDAARGSLNIVYEYLEQLRELGVYNNTTIMIIADHGSGGDRPTNPLFLFKPQQSTGDLKVNSAPVCQEDLFATVMEDIGLNEKQKYGVSAMNIPEDSERERYFMFYTWDDAWDSDYLPQMTKYGIQPQSNDSSSYYPIEYAINPYTLGTPVSFALSGNGDQYTISGFSVPEGDYTWSAAQKATMAFELQDELTQDLVVDLQWKHVITENQRMVVKAKETVLFDQEVNANGSASIYVPRNLLDGNVLKLNFEFPDAMSPNEMTGSDDFRTLSVAFTNLTIS